MKDYLSVKQRSFFGNSLFALVNANNKILGKHLPLPNIRDTHLFKHCFVMIQTIYYFEKNI